MAQGGWTGAAGGAMAGFSLGGPLGGIIGAGLGFFTNMFGGGAEPQMESDEARRMRETLTNQYMAQLQNPAGFTPQQTATLQEAVAQQYMNANREVGQRVNQYQASRGLLDSSSSAMAQGQAQRDLSAQKAQGMANITLQDLMLQQQNRQQAFSGLQGLLGTMNQTDLARYNQALQRQQTIGQLWGQAIGTYQSAQVPDYLNQLTVPTALPTAQTPAATPGLPISPYQGDTGIYQQPGGNVQQQVTYASTGALRPATYAMSARTLRPTTYAQSQGFRRFPQNTMATNSPIYNVSRRFSNMAPTQRVW